MNQEEIFAHYCYVHINVPRSVHGDAETLSKVCDRTLHIMLDVGNNFTFLRLLSI